MVDKPIEMDLSGEDETKPVEMDLSSSKESSAIQPQTNQEDYRVEPSNFNKASSAVMGGLNFAGKILNEVFVEPVVEYNHYTNQMKASGKEMSKIVDEIKKQKIPDEQKKEQIDALMGEYVNQSKENILGASSALLKMGANVTGAGTAGNLGLRALLKANKVPTLFFGLSALADAEKNNATAREGIASTAINTAGAMGAGVIIPKATNKLSGIVKDVFANGSGTIKKARTIGEKIVAKFKESQLNDPAFNDVMEDLSVLLPQKSYPLEPVVTYSQKMAGAKDNSISEQIISTIKSKRKEAGQLVSDLKTKSLDKDQYLNAKQVLETIDNALVIDGEDIGITKRLVPKQTVRESFVQDRDGIFQKKRIIEKTYQSEGVKTSLKKELDKLRANILDKSSGIKKTVEEIDSGNYDGLSINFHDLHNALTNFQQNYNHKIVERAKSGDISSKPAISSLETVMQNSISKVQKMIDTHVENLPDIGGQLASAKSKYRVISNSLSNLGTINENNASDIASTVMSMTKPNHADEYNALKDVIPKDLFKLALSASLKRKDNVERVVATATNKSGTRREGGNIIVNNIEKFVAGKHANKPNYEISGSDKFISGAGSIYGKIGKAKDELVERSKQSVRQNIFSEIEKQVNKKK